MRDAAEIRTIYTSEFGLNRPAGLSYVPQRNEFLVAGPGRTHTRLLRLNREAELRGSVRLPRLEEPGTLAFDAGQGRLSGVAADRLISIRADDLIDDQPSVTRTEAPALPIASARSTTFDAIGHRWFVLGRAGIRVFSSTNPGRTRSTRLIPQGIDPARFSAIAFNPSDRLLYA
ncbi:MAG: hypothetical protein M3516_01805, partial [Actinomycetota bacterium]|nr:hypothetical protein [Actinomycetota bacterium]